MKKITCLIAALLLAALQSPAQSKFPAKFHIDCTGKLIKQLSIEIYSQKSSGKFTFKDTRGNRYKGSASLVYPDRSHAGIYFDKGLSPATKDSELLGILRYDNDGMILSDAESHQGVLRWKLNSAGAKFLTTYDPFFDRADPNISGSGQKEKGLYDEFTVICKGK